jgi:hypothetical protein
MNRPGWALAFFALVGVCATTPALGRAGEEPRNFLRLTGSADWELFRSDGVNGSTRSTFNAIRQRYGVDLAGSIWDYRFNRFLVGLDLFRDDRRVDDRREDSTNIGYRAEGTFFPNRPFPLRLFARRSTIDYTGVGLGGDRETAAWGVEWNLATTSQRNVHVQYDRSSYDLESSLALRERRSNGVVEFSQRFRRREISLRYGQSDQRELIRDTRFARRDLTLSDRTRFENGMVLLFHGVRTMSNARFTSGELDQLSQNRLSANLDVPRRNRVGFNFGYDFNDNSGKFVNSTNHQARGNVRVLLNEHWETFVGAAGGTLESRIADATMTQDTTGGNLGVRYNRDWSHLELASVYTVGLSRTTYEVEPDRTVTHQGFDLHLRVPVGESAALLGSATIRQNETDVTGAAVTFDETVVRGGFEAGVGAGLRGQLSVYRRDAIYDTFQFGLQESTEYGLEGTLSEGRGSVSMTVWTRRGISEFIPDPAAGGPFLPGTDLVSAADALTAGAHWRFLRRLSLRVQARYEDRLFSTIGQETILSYHPELEWSPGVWRFVVGVTHYARNNGTSFEQDTLLLRASRRFF